MVLPWLTFALMILIQTSAAAAVVATVKTTLDMHSKALADMEMRLRPVEDLRSFVLGGQLCREHEHRLNTLEKA